MTLRSVLGAMRRKFQPNASSFEGADRRIADAQLVT